jgi:putative transcriptional regulator
MVKIKVNDILDKKNLSVYYLSKKTEISYNNLSKLIKGETRSISFEIIDKICSALDCEVGDIIEYVPDEN